MDLGQWIALQSLILIALSLCIKTIDVFFTCNLQNIFAPLNFVSSAQVSDPVKIFEHIFVTKLIILPIKIHTYILLRITHFLSNQSKLILTINWRFLGSDTIGHKTDIKHKFFRTRSHKSHKTQQSPRNNRILQYVHLQDTKAQITQSYEYCYAVNRESAGDSPYTVMFNGPKWG